jgi:RNA polymerase sigma-54 factor
MQQVADKLGLHETTISRAIANKYLETPSGMYEFKFFFTGGYQSSEGDEISSRGIKEKIKDLIADENKSKPLSDNKISKSLKADGLNVARRTVAKYREQLGIQATNLRRVF